MQALTVWKTRVCLTRFMYYKLRLYKKFDCFSVGSSEFLILGIVS